MEVDRTKGSITTALLYFDTMASRRTTTWSTPQRRPSSMSSGWRREIRPRGAQCRPLRQAGARGDDVEAAEMLPASSRWRHGAGHDVAHRRCREAGTLEYDAVELAKVPPTLSSRSRGRQRHGARHDATHHRCRQAGAAEDDDMEYDTMPPTVDVVKTESRKTTTWSTPRRCPPSMSSSLNRGRRRHGARHDAAHRRRRQAGAVEDDDMEHATTLPTVEVVKPVPRKTMT
ncbi:hypothetical protein D1007_38589 [Hordeum vulgare]|nr:hypothetical protein D1007_38589 [Hordeum vulgare]